jgi:2-dehydro-3-deoxy-D-arabinonate dehydratase
MTPTAAREVGEGHTVALWKVETAEGARFARGPVDTGPQQLLPVGTDLDAILAGGVGALAEALATSDGPVPEGARLLAPLGGQEVWAAGVTYRRSRDARMEEADDPDHYDLVYDADRPELFFKATAARTRGPGERIGIRSDSSWDVPEAELGLVVSSAGEIVGYVVGDDVSSRSIEGENPLYLPQAKNYTGSCAVGPCLVPIDEAPPFDQLRIELRIEREGEAVYEDQVPITEMHRRPAELVDWLFRALEFPIGVVLLTGTALVPPSEFTLRQDDRVTIAIPGVGSLTNPVEVVGRLAPQGAR